MKRQAGTAIAVYHEDIEPTILGRQMFVRGNLARYIARRAQTPTGLELLALMQEWFPDSHLDVNSIRPRLTELAAKGLVRRGPKRTCSMSGKTAITWELAEPPTPSAETPPAEPLPQTLFDDF